MKIAVVEPIFEAVLPPVPTGLYGGQVIATGLTEIALRESIGIEEHLKFIERLLGEHKVAAHLCRAVQRIRDRLADPRLYLAVVGEFNAGKSTFINALIREDLLRAEVIQGTTAAATLLGYGPALNVQVTLASGSVGTSPHPPPATMQWSASSAVRDMFGSPFCINCTVFESVIPWVDPITGNTINDEDSEF